MSGTDLHYSLALLYMYMYYHIVLLALSTGPAWSTIRSLRTLDICTRSTALATAVVSKTRTRPRLPLPEHCRSLGQQMQQPSAQTIAAMCQLEGCWILYFVGHFCTAETCSQGRLLSANLLAAATWSVRPPAFNNHLLAAATWSFQQPPDLPGHPLSATTWSVRPLVFGTQRHKVQDHPGFREHQSS